MMAGAIVNAPQLESLNLASNELRDAGALILALIFSPSKHNTYYLKDSKVKFEGGSMGDDL